MILKCVLSAAINQHEVFEITNYFAEDEYLEADIHSQGRGVGDREIVLQAGLYLDESEEWESITILTDAGVQLVKFEKIVEEAQEQEQPIATKEGK